MRKPQLTGLCGCPPRWTTAGAAMVHVQGVNRFDIAGSRINEGVCSQEVLQGVRRVIRTHSSQQYGANQREAVARPGFFERHFGRSAPTFTSSRIICAMLRKLTAARECALRRSAESVQSLSKPKGIE